MKLVAWAFVLIGVASLAACAWLTHASIRLSRHGVVTQGLVIELERSSTKGGRYVFRPVVAFVTGTGERKEIRSGYASNPAPHNVGDRVPVRYLPTDPDGVFGALVDASWWTVWWPPLLAFALGPIFIVLGWLFRKHVR